MEVDDNKNLYEVEQYDGKDDFPQRPIANLQIHDTVPVGRKGFYCIVGIQAFIILILIILLGINGVTLTHLNTVDMCDSTGATTGGVVGTTSDNTDLILNLTRELFRQRDNDIKMSQNFFQVLANNTARQLLQAQEHTDTLNGSISQVSQQLGSKVDDMRSVVDEHLVDTLNMSDVLDQVKNTTGQSAQKLINIVNTLSNLQDTGISTAGVADDILLIAQELLVLHNESAALPTSCKQVQEQQPNSPSGYYILAGPTGTYSTYCNMGTLCGSGVGWTRLAYLDMTDATQSCPSGFRLYQSGGVRACGRPGTSSGSCSSVTFPSNSLNYSQICGRVTGYQYYSADAFHGPSNINSYYVDGVSITRGSPRQHVWTLANGLTDSYNNHPYWICPCATGSTQTVPSFVGNHYFCESGNQASTWTNILYTSDPLWDGQGCGSLEATCCSAPGLPWFHRDYGSTTTTDYIEMRVCGNSGSANNEDTTVSFYEIYVK